MTRWFAISIGVLLLGSPLPCLALWNNADMNVYMFRTYTDPVYCPNFTNPQWENYDDFVAEMDDVADCYQCIKDPDDFWYRLMAWYADPGLFADLIAIATHGGNSGVSGSGYYGYLCDLYCGDANSRYMEPTTGDTDIYLIFACSYMSRYNNSNWYGFRNAHRRGAAVMAGCWGLCYLYGDPNPTWSEVGDQLADAEESIYNAWSEGFSIYDYDDDIIVNGSGLRGDGAMCAYRAMYDDFPQRHGLKGPTWGSDRALGSEDGDPELCGYYWTNI